MTTEIGDFFIASNVVHDIKETDYEQIDLLVKAAKAFARNTHQGVYIIDYFKRDFLYVSENLANWCGVPSAKIKEFGYQLYIDHVPEKDQEMLLKINSSGFALYDTFPIEDRLEYTISYDFHLTWGRKRRLINHHLTPMVQTNDGRIWLALCTIEVSAHDKPGNIVMRKSGSDTYYEYSLDRSKWITKKSVTLNEAERDVLLLSAQGLTMNEIADRLCKSVDTIKTCKRVMFAKLDVKNIVEALSFAANNKMI